MYSIQKALNHVFNHHYFDQQKQRCVVFCGIFDYTCVTKLGKSKTTWLRATGLVVQFTHRQINMEAGSGSFSHFTQDNYLFIDVCTMHQHFHISLFSPNCSWRYATFVVFQSIRSSSQEIIANVQPTCSSSAASSSALASSSPPSSSSSTTSSSSSSNSSSSSSSGSSSI